MSKIFQVHLFLQAQSLATILKEAYLNILIGEPDYANARYEIFFVLSDAKKITLTSSGSIAPIIIYYYSTRSFQVQFKKFVTCALFLISRTD